MFTATKQSSAATAIFRLLSASRLSTRSSSPARLLRLRSIASVNLQQVAARSLHSSATWHGHAATAEAEIEEEAEDLADASQSAQRVDERSSPSGTITKFTELKDRGLVCTTVVDTLTKSMGLTTMTEVQSKTINETLKGIDV